MWLFVTIHKIFCTGIHHHPAIFLFFFGHLFSFLYTKAIIGHNGMKPPWQHALIYKKQDKTTMEIQHPSNEWNDAPDKTRHGHINQSHDITIQFNCTNIHHQKSLQISLKNFDNFLAENIKKNCKTWWTSDESPDESHDKGQNKSKSINPIKKAWMIYIQ